MARRATTAGIAEIAQDQWGLITRRQMERAGIPPTTLDRLTAQGSGLERVAHGVYRLTGAPVPDHLDLRAAWLQLAPETPVWERTPDQGVVSHRSAAALYELGHLPADTHEFTLPTRRQSRRSDVRLHRRPLRSAERITLHGLPVTRPSQIAADLLDDREDPEAVAHLIADATRSAYDHPGTFADALAPHAAAFGPRRGDGLALLRWLLDIVGDRDTGRWMDEAREHAARATVQGGAHRRTPLVPPRALDQGLAVQCLEYAGGVARRELRGGRDLWNAVERPHISEKADKPGRLRTPDPHTSGPPAPSRFQRGSRPRPAPGRRHNGQDMPEQALLERELDTFEKRRQELLGQAQGKFALVHGEEIVGVFDSKPDAIAAGFKEFGNTPFLVKQVVAVETPQNFVSNQLAI
jgi:hypothetical protein